jgi:DNA-binding CsgD family transcriptional regulator
MWLARESERAQGTRFVDALEAGPAALVLTGEAGIGKTTLWRTVVDAARSRGVRVLACRGVETEAKLALTALTDLLADVDDGALAGLPRPQRRALEAALLRGARGRAGGDRRALATAALAVVRALAREMPLLIAVDDVQWIDRSSARVLEFVAHRLGAARVGMLFAVRTPLAPPFDLERVLGEERVQTLALASLGVGALRRILTERSGRPLPRGTVARIAGIAGGNPFFALEMARAWMRAGATSEGEPPFPERLAGLVSDRIRALPPATRRALIAAAASARPTAQLVAKGAGSASAQAALARARRGGVVAGSRDAIHFTHPLFAAAVYADASPEERRRVHGRLARVVRDPEERGRHLALAALGPDESLARRVDDAARRAFARGAPDAAAELARHALRLTPPGNERAALRRAMTEVSCCFAAGDPALAAGVLERLRHQVPAGATRAEVLWRLATAHRFLEGYEESSGLLLEARAQARVGPALRSVIERDLALAHIVTVRWHDAAACARSAVVNARRCRSERVRREAFALLLYVRFLMGEGFDLQHARRARLDASASPDLPIDRTPIFLLGTLAQWSDDFDTARRCFAVLHRRAVERGHEAELSTLLAKMAELECWSGRWQLAGRYADEALELANLVGHRFGVSVALYTRAAAAACLGHAERARSDAQAGLDLVGGGSVVAWWFRSVLAFLELSQGNAQAAERQLAPLAELLIAGTMSESAPVRFVADAIEARVAIGALEPARELLEAFEACASRLGRPYGLATSARARALLLAAEGEPEAALGALDVALEHHEQLPMPLERGRTLLVKGRVLRRSKRKRAAAEALGEAVGIFETLGAPLWAAQAKQELARVGLRPRAPQGLTPIEARVADLAAAGHSTREVAAQVFLAPKSVEGVLGRVYAKLGVHSRAALANAMAARRSAAPS